MMRKVTLALAVVSAVLSTQASAELFGFAMGRSANVANYTNLSVEGGIQVGDVDFYGARATFKLSDQLAAYGDFGIADFDYGYGYDDDGFAFGGGVIYSLLGLLPDVDTAVKGGFHLASGDHVDYSAFSVRGLISGDVPTQNVTMNWYGSLGLEFINYDFDFCNYCDDSDTELAFGGGVVLPIGPGEAYGGLEYIDDMMLAVGYRVGLQ